MWCPVRFASDSVCIQKGQMMHNEGDIFGRLGEYVPRNSGPAVSEIRPKLRRWPFSQIFV